MIGTPISLGLYTVYDALRADLPGTLQKVVDIGYDGVEFYGPLEWDADAVRRVLEKSGLALTGWHVEWALLQSDTIEGTAHYLHNICCPCAIVPCLGGQWQVAHRAEDECRPLWEGYADRMNAISARLAAEGIALGYHNHEHEFQLRYDGQTVFDILFDRLNPAVVMELDTGNAIEGDTNPADVLQRYQDRQVLLHCKPWSRQIGFDVLLGEPGDCNNWPEILDAGRKNICALVVESEAGGDGFANATSCLQALQRIIK